MTSLVKSQEPLGLGNNLRDRIHCMRLEYRSFSETAFLKLLGKQLYRVAWHIASMSELRLDSDYVFPCTALLMQRTLFLKNFTIRDQRKCTVHRTCFKLMENDQSLLIYLSIRLTVQALTCITISMIPRNHHLPIT